MQNRWVLVSFVQINGQPSYLEEGEGETARRRGAGLITLARWEDSRALGTDKFADRASRPRHHPALLQHQHMSLAMACSGQQGKGSRHFKYAVYFCLFRNRAPSGLIAVMWAQIHLSYNLKFVSSYEDAKRLWCLAVRRLAGSPKRCGRQPLAWPGS